MRSNMTDGAKMMLLMIRCGFMGDRKYLTPKGRGVLPEWVWTAYARLRCKVDAKFRGEVIAVLRRAERVTLGTATPTHSGNS